MMASMAPNFQHPGAMPGHGGIPPGHPMGPGHPGNQGMPGGQHQVSMANQMHGMVGGPQAGHGPVMGVPQGGAPGVSGAGPNAHAMSHLNPSMSQQQQLYHQQQMQAALGNPQLLQQQQHQRAMHARLMHQNQLNQHQAQLQGGMVMNSNAPMNMMNPAGNVQLPPHLQHLQQQQQAAHYLQQQHRMQAMQQHQQQQQALSQMASGANQPGGQAPMRPPSTIPGAPDGQGPAGTPGPQQHPPPQPGQQGQHHPQQPGQGQPHGTPQQPQGPAPGQPQPGQQQPPQGPGTPQPNNGPRVQGPGQPQPPPQPGQPPDMAAQQQQRQHMLQAQMMQARLAQQTAHQQQAQQQQAQQAQQQQQQQAQQQQQQQQAQQAQQQQAQQQQRQNPLKGASILSLYQFGESLGQYSARQANQGTPMDLHYWRTFVKKFFSDTGVLRQQFSSTQDQRTSGMERKYYEIGSSTLPRYYWTYYKSGVENIQMLMENAHEMTWPGIGHFVESSRCSFIYWYTNGHQVVATGNLKAQFNQQGKIEVLDHAIVECHEYVPRAELIARQPASPEQKPSPSASKTAGKKAAQQRMNRQQLQEANANPVPKSAVGEWGVHPAVFQLVEIASTMTMMEPIIYHARHNTHISPLGALQQLVANNNQQAANANAAAPNMPGGEVVPAFPQPTLVQQTPGGQRTPGGQPFGPGPGGPQPFASPAHPAHLNLPNAGSPAAMSMSPAVKGHGLPPGAGGPGGPGGPAPGGVAMVAQQSAQGSSSGAGGGGSQGTSANNSPHVNKKRRQSAVKAELQDEAGGGGGAPEVNGTAKVKASPRMQGNKRQKG